MDWTAGYVADIAYMSGYFGELNPAKVPMGLLNVGFAPPKIENACELGFGQGVTVAMHAAAQPHINWYGDDFNPSHALTANWMVDAAGVKADLTEESFEEFCRRDDLPMFDMIGLHGIWSWVTPENRGYIVDFLRRKLRPGGVAYISYNVMPGWAVTAPLRQLFAMHAEMTAGRGISSSERMENALQFVETMLSKDPAYLRANPGLKERFDQIKAMPRAYVIHEYLNANWSPQYFYQIAGILGEAKLEYACSASYHDALDEIHLTPAQLEWVQSIDNEPFRETVQDYLRNTQFRRDYWVKGGRRLSTPEQIEAIRDQRVVLPVPLDKVPTQIATSAGQVSLIPATYDPLKELLSDHKPRSFREIEVALAPKGIQFGQVLQAVMLLNGLGALSFCQTEAQTAAARKSTAKLNSALVERARYAEEFQYLVSPVTGGGVGLARPEQLFLAAARRGPVQAERLAQYAGEALDAVGHRVMIEGRLAETPEENRKALLDGATAFIERYLPIMDGLQIALEGNVASAGRKQGR
jgi:SAM-dependent methyltransferase